MRVACLLVIAAIAAVAAEPAIRLPSTLWCVKGYERRLQIDLVGRSAEGLAVRADPASAVAATLRPAGAGRLELRLSASAESAVELVDADRRSLARAAVRLIAISTDAARSISSDERLPDGSDVFFGQIILTPYALGLDVRFACLSGQVTVPDGLAERWIASETFVPSPSGDSAQTTFRMVRQPGAKWVPFTYVIYQDGEQISPP